MTDAEAQTVVVIRAVQTKVDELLSMLESVEGTDLRILALARTDLMKGFWWAERAVVKPLPPVADSVAE